MNAKLVLQLWRERWGKGRDSLPNKSFVRGRVFKWAENIPNASAWSTPGLSIGVLIASLLFFLLSINIEFTLNGQITFAGLMVITALFLRRYDGSLITLTLICLSVLCSAQYFVWRFSQTLVVRSDATFFVPFALCIIELCVAFYLLLGWLKRLWPIEQEEMELFSIEHDAAYVDVVLVVSGMSHDEVVNSLRHCREIDWAARKLKLFVIDNEPRPDLEPSIAQFSAVNLIPKEAIAEDSSMIERVLVKSSGDFLMVIDAPFEAKSDFLERVMGWFDNDMGLAMLYSAQHFMAPKLSDMLGPGISNIAASKDAAKDSFAILRRSAWQNEWPLMFKRSALMLTRAEPLPQDLFSTHSHSPARFIRIDRADSKAWLTWKQRVVRLHELLQFYGPLAYLFVLLTPLAFLLKGMTLVKAKPELFACYALPALLLMGTLQARKTQEGRWTEFREIKEMLLSSYMLFATARSYLSTALTRPQLIIARWFSELSLSQWTLGLVLTLLLLLNISAVAVGVFMIFNEVTGEKKIWTAAYMLWALVNALLLLARQAIFQESCQIKWFAEKTQKLSAMIRLPFGRTLACETVNFPAKELGLSTPVALASARDEYLSMSIFHNNQAFNLTVQAIRTEGSTTFVRLGAHQQAELYKLKEAVFARGKDWPKWLPPREADHPLPVWLSSFLAAIPIKLLDASMNITKYLRLDVLVQMWKNRT